jgi:hypothetical protein
MANITFDQTTEKASPTTADKIPIWDVAAGQAKWATITNIINARMTGGGIVATGGFTLTVPATGTAALQEVSSVFTVAQSFNPAAVGANAIVINMPTSTTGTAMVVQYNSTNAIRAIVRAALNQFILDPRDLGNNVAGPQVTISRNTNAGAEGPAPGALNLVRANGNATILWFDNSADLRFGSAAPTGSSGSPTTGLTSGTVVGTQTSMAAAKDIFDELGSIEEVAERIRAGADAVRRFVYKSGSFGGEQFEGVVTDLAPAYGMDRDKEHPQGRSLNEIQILGDLLRMMAHIIEKVG